MTHHEFRAVPVLRIFDFDKAREFYVGFLGFSVDWEHRFEPGLPVYMQVSRDGLVLHLSEHHGDGSPGAVVLVYTKDLTALQAELAAKEYPYLRPSLDEGPVPNSLSMQLQDPFGNRLGFHENLGVA